MIKFQELPHVLQEELRQRKNELYVLLDPLTAKEYVRFASEDVEYNSIPNLLLG